MKVFWHIARILLGLVFIFSGFVKGIDPWGSAYKFTDYFSAWGMDGLSSLSLPLGILLSATEFITGLALLTNVFLRFFSIVALLFMFFFTGLTLFIAIKDPVTDCGCFGDALVLTNWQTFYKNIVFLAFAVIVFRYRSEFGPAKLSLIPAILSGATVLVFAYLVDYSFNHLPIIDFRPYKVGANIIEGMKVPEGAPADEWTNIMYYKNKTTGKTEKFNQDNYPWQDSLTWEFVSMDSKLVKKGYEPPVQNFTIETSYGEDIKDFFLYDDNFTFILVAYNLEKSNKSKINEIRELSQYAMNDGLNFIGLTSTIYDEAEQFVQVYDLPFEFFNCDEITLKTMIRSNPGLFLLKSGTVLYKWHYNDIPSVDEFIKHRAYLEKTDPS